MVITALDILIVLLLVALLCLLVIRLFRTVPNSGLKALVQTKTGKLLVVITSLVLVLTFAFFYLAFVLGC